MTKPRVTLKKGGWAIVAIAAVAVTIAGAAWAANSLSGDSAKPNVSNKCATGKHVKHKVVIVIKDAQALPGHIVASLCDALTITNKDDLSRLMAFGKHEAHVPYDGVSERFLIKGESFTVTLNQAGDFLVHDHNDETVQATFTVR